MKIKRLILVLVTLAMAGSALFATPEITNNPSNQIVKETSEKTVKEEGAGKVSESRVSSRSGLNVAKGGSRFPGIDPAKAPEGFQWRGKLGSTPGSKQGTGYNPKTGESLHPDLNHSGPIGPHWDYIDPLGKEWRIFPDGREVPK